MIQEQRTHTRSVSVRHAAVLTACLGSIALLATVYWLAAVRVPDPATADREGLMRWLVLRDLRSEPPEIRITLLQRLQEEAGGDLDPAVIGEQLDERYHDRLWTNVLVLIETWYLNRVDIYHATPTSDRAACLDQTIAEVQHWEDLASLQPREAQDASSSEAAMLELVGNQVAIWKERASPERQREIAEFDVALRGRWFLRALGLTPGKAS
jgi:hypothetical protein